MFKRQKSEPKYVNGSSPSHWQIFCTFLYLGCTSFGGPVAHIGYFRNLLVERKNWLNAQAYSDLVALCQFLPGPASSQVGFAIGLVKGGYFGGLAAFLGFTLPSALILLTFSIGLDFVGGVASNSLLAGLKLVAVSVVGHAVVMMGNVSTPDWPRRSMAFLAAVVVLLVGHPFVTMFVIFLGGFFGLMLPQVELQFQKPRNRIGGYNALVFIILALSLLILLPILAYLFPTPLFRLLDGFYRSGMLVFGGGHVVLPLLEGAVVDTGLVSEADFLVGYGAAQAIPGPMFAVAAFLGQKADIGIGGVGGAAISLLMIFLGPFLLVLGVMPFWERLRHHKGFRKALDGVNASVVGLLTAILINPLTTAAITTFHDAVIVGVGFLFLWRCWLSPIFVVGLIVTSKATIDLIAGS